MKSFAIAMLALLAVVSASACMGKTIKGEESGRMEITNVEPCTMTTPGMCYDINGSIAHGELQFSGSGFVDPTACTTDNKAGACCPQIITGSATGAHHGQTADFEFSAMVPDCVNPKKPTTAKFKGPFMVTGTAGALKGAQGVGEFEYTEKCDSDCLTSPEPGSGRIKVRGHETAP